MFRKDEAVSAALRLLLTPKQVAIIEAARGRSRKQLLQILVNAGLKWNDQDQQRRAEWWHEHSIAYQRGDFQEDTQ